MSRPRTWTDDQLRRVLAEGECNTSMDVVVALGPAGLAHLGATLTSVDGRRSVVPTRPSSHCAVAQRTEMILAAK